MVHRFVLPSAARVGDIVALDAGESRHARRVLRLAAGDSVAVTNGRGQEWEAEIVEAGESVRVRLARERGANRGVDCALSVAVPFPKGSRADFLVEKLVELGVAEILPLATRRSVGRAGDAGRARFERWGRIVRAAVKQSGRTVEPAVSAPVDLIVLARRAAEWPVRLVAAPGAGVSVRMALMNQARPVRVLGVVGPEGGLTPEETAALTAAGFVPVSLGSGILRVETAALALAAQAGVAWT